MRRIENFLRASEVKVFAKNSHEMIEYSEAWQSFRDLNFKNPLESHFSCNKKCFVSHKVIIQSALYSSDPVQCFTNSERMRMTHRNFLRASQINVLAKNSHKMIEHSEAWQTFE